MTDRKRPQKISMNHPTMEILSINLRKIMEERGLTQLQLEELASAHGGLSQKTISNILRRVRSIHLEQLDVLADTFGIPPAQLLSETFEVKALSRKKGGASHGLPPYILRAAKKLEKLPEDTRNTMLSLIDSFSTANVRLSKAKKQK